MVSGESLERVWEPLEIGPVRTKNRIMISGQSQFYGRDGVVSDRHVAFYEERARGGVGLLVLEAQAVHPAVRNYHAVCHAWEPRSVPHYQRLVDAVHAHGAPLFVQLLAYGAQGSSTQYADSWQPLWSASGIPNPACSEKPMAIEQSQVDELVAHFALSARHVKEAGFDGIEIHAAHSLLLGEFLSPTFNKRTDRYGGSTRSRCQLVIEVAEAIRAVVGTDLAVGIRLSMDEFLGELGITQEESAAQIAVLHETGLFDFFDISAGGYYSLHMLAPPMGRVKQGFLAPLSQRAKDIVGNDAKVFVVGRILDLARAEEILASGAADMVAMTRAHVADPGIIAKTLEGRTREIQRCIGANVCLQSSVYETRGMACLVNPSAGRERELGSGTLQLVPQEDAKRILVVGGGPAGMKVAGVAAQRGHHVTLCERDDELGGHLNALKGLPTRGEWQSAIENLAQPLEVFGVEVRLGSSVDRSQASDEYQAVVCATGSRWDARGASSFRPDRESIPGADLPHVTTADGAARRAVADPRSFGARALIVDQSETYLPLAIAEQLAAAGVGVEIITPWAVFGAQTLKSAEMYFVGPRLRQLGVRWRTEHFVEGIDANQATIYHVFGGDHEEMFVDAVILCLSRESDTALYDALRGHHPMVLRSGDALSPQPLEAVIHGAERLGRAL